MSETEQSNPQDASVIREHPEASQDQAGVVAVPQQQAQNAANTLYTGRPIGAELCNCLVTEAPLTRAECDHLRKHFAALEHMLVTSGPRFSNARRDAVEMHNRAVRRLRGILDEVRRRAALAEEDELMEIQ